MSRVCLNVGVTGPDGGDSGGEVVAVGTPKVTPANI